MKVQIRGEQVQDYHGIATVHAKAFTHDATMGEVTLVDVHRHSRSFDPELSLVAELNGRVVGHLLVTPQDMLIHGTRMQAGILAPVAVDPVYQNAGIGGQLIEEVHRRCTNKGMQFCTLLGHATYYPRFGYTTKMFGTCEVHVQREEVSPEHGAFETRRVTQDDIPALTSLWDSWFGDVDLAIIPGPSLLNWISPDTHVKSHMVYEEGEWVGYVRYQVNQPERPRLFLAPGRTQTTRLLTYLGSLTAEHVEMIALPIHPDGNAVQQFLPHRAKQSVRTWDAAMIKVLNPANSLVTRYCEAVSSGRQLPGLVVWPVEFDVC